MEKTACKRGMPFLNKAHSCDKVCNLMLSDAPSVSAHELNLTRCLAIVSILLMPMWKVSRETAACLVFRRVSGTMRGERPGNGNERWRDDYSQIIHQKRKKRQNDVNTAMNSAVMYVSDGTAVSH